MHALHAQDVRWTQSISYSLIISKVKIMKDKKPNIPIVIGIVGHRNVSSCDCTKLHVAVKEYIENLKIKYPCTDFVMLNSLAIGADTICAEVAGELGMEIICPLPFSEEEYEKDFVGDDLIKFKELISKCKKKFVVDSTVQDKDRGYSSAGTYIADNCNILIAIWDGVYTGLISGTSHTVKERKDRNESLKRLKSIRKVPIYHIHVEKSESNKESTFNANYLDEKPDFEPDFEYINQINADKHKPGEGYPAIENLNRDSGLYDIDRYYRMIDQCALVYRDYYYIVCFMISFLSTCVVMSFLLYDEADILLMLIVYPLALIIYYVMIKISEKFRIYRKYYYYRTIAEMLRVQIYLFASGISENVTKYISWVRSREISWMEDIIVSIKAISRECKQLSDDEIMKHWIESQFEYHTRSIRKKERQINFNNSIVRSMMILTFLLYVVILVAEFKFGVWFGKLFLGISFRAWAKVLWGTFAAISLFWSNYFEKFSLERQKDDNRKMKEMYEIANESFKELNDDNKKALLKNLAHEEIGENIEWLSYMSGNTISFEI